MIERLADDHANARLLAQGLAQLDGIVIEPEVVETDIVIFELHRDDMSPANPVGRSERFRRVVESHRQQPSAGGH